MLTIIAAVVIGQSHSVRNGYLSQSYVAPTCAAQAYHAPPLLKTDVVFVPSPAAPYAAMVGAIARQQPGYGYAMPPQGQPPQQQLAYPPPAAQPPQYQQPPLVQASPQQPTFAAPPPAPTPQAETPPPPTKGQPPLPDKGSPDFGAVPPPPVANPGVGSVDPNGLDAQVMNQFRVDCKSCHTAGSLKGNDFALFNPDGSPVPLTSFDKKAVADKVLIGDMPPARPYDPAKKQLVSNWIMSDVDNYIALLKQFKAQRR